MNGPIIRAAGGVLWKPGPGGTDEQSGVEVAVIHRPRYDDWTLPKGKLDPGEEEIAGAIREVMEETGYRVQLGRALGEIRYVKHSARGSRPKVVRFWAMKAVGGKFSPTPEVDDLRWVPLDHADHMLSYDRDRDVLKKFVRGPALIRTILLVRHATAGSRDEWEGDDRVRPLDAKGRLQADGLVRILSRFEVHEIVSADFVRCVQTVEPLAEAIGLSVKEEPLFSELGYPDNEGAAIDLLRHIGSADAATVVCSQGGVIPDLLSDLADADHVDLPSDLNAKKGSTWVLSFDADRLFSADYLPPPKVLSEG